jgi:hypothetical protein
VVIGELNERQRLTLELVILEGMEFRTSPKDSRSRSATCSTTINVVLNQML